MDENRTNSDKPLNEDGIETGSMLARELAKYQADMLAMQQEFNQIADNGDDESSPEAVRKAIIVAAPRAIQEIITLSTMAESESVRANTSKYIIDVAMGKIKIGDTDQDNLNKLLNELMGNDEKKDKKKV